jgi:hypothetical protein
MKKVLQLHMEMVNYEGIDAEARPEGQPAG